MSSILKFNFLLILTTLISISCNKNEENDLPNPDQITIDDELSINRYAIDTIVSLGVPHQEYSIMIDVDKDAVYDFKFTSSFNPSPMSSNRRLEIHCLNKNSFICNEIHQDTTFLSSTIDTNYIDGKTYIVSSNYVTCARMGTNDSILRIQQKSYIKSNMPGDTLSLENLWSNNTFQLFNGSGSRNNPAIREISDTIFVNETIFDSYCHQLFINNIVYIGIKIDNNEFKKIGWLKIEEQDNNDLKLLEVAIQN